MNINLIKEILVRVQNSSPTLFKRLQYVFFSFAALIVILKLLSPLHLNLHGFEVYVNWNTFLVLLAFGGINMLPVSDPNVLPTKKKENDDETGGSSGTEIPGNGQPPPVH